jgi:hypothetical protein
MLDGSIGITRNIGSTAMDEHNPTSPTTSFTSERIPRVLLRELSVPEGPAWPEAVIRAFWSVIQSQGQRVLRAFRAEAWRLDACWQARTSAPQMDTTYRRALRRFETHHATPQHLCEGLELVHKAGHLDRQTTTQLQERIMEATNANGRWLWHDKEGART